MNIRLLPPVEPALQTRIVNGRSYTAAPGNVVDVYDADAEVLSGNSWTVIAPSGPTSARPTGTLGQYTATPGFLYYDTTISKLIIFDGANWRSPVDGSSV